MMIRNITAQIFIVVFLTLHVLVACNGEDSRGVIGEEKELYFKAVSPSTNKVFSTINAVGAVHEIHVVNVNTTEKRSVLELQVRSSNLEVFKILSSDPQADDLVITVEITGIGEASLEAHLNDKKIDHIILKAAPIGTAYLTDISLKGSEVDLRIPQKFAIIRHERSKFGVKVYDKCGGELALGRNTVLGLKQEKEEDSKELDNDAGVSDAGVEIEDADSGFEDEEAEEKNLEIKMASYGFQITAEEQADYILELKISDVLLSTLDLKSVNRSDVDELNIYASSYSNNQAELWIRTYADGIEVIGAKSQWKGDASLDLVNKVGQNYVDVKFSSQRDRGKNINVDLSDQDSEEDPDFDDDQDSEEDPDFDDDQNLEDRSVEVSVYSLEETMELDKKPSATLKSRLAQIDNVSAGCGDAETACDPLIAFFLVFLRPLRKKIKKLSLEK